MDMINAIEFLKVLPCHKIPFRKLPKTNLGNNGSSTFLTNSVKDLLPYVKWQMYKQFEFLQQGPDCSSKLAPIYRQTSTHMQARHVDF